MIHKNPQKMRSLVEQASSVSKAIEQGWLRAGTPSEFSIKILEVAEKNFIGMTTKPAKIGIFFPEESSAPVAKYATKTPSVTEHPVEQKQETLRTPKIQKRRAQEPIAEKKEKTVTPSSPMPKKERVVWTESMVAEAQTLLSSTLTFLSAENVPFAIHADNYYLKISFEKTLYADKEREKVLFRSLAHLLMQCIRNKFKKGFHGLKIILSSP